MDPWTNNPLHQCIESSTIHKIVAMDLTSMTMALLTLQSLFDGPSTWFDLDSKGKHSGDERLVRGERVNSRQFYATPSKYCWLDELGRAQQIAQFEGGEQGGQVTARTMVPMGTRWCLHSEPFPTPRLFEPCPSWWGKASRKIGQAWSLRHDDDLFHPLSDISGLCSIGISMQKQP